MRPHVSSLLVLSDLSQGAIHRYYECRRRLLTVANQAGEQKRWKWCILLRSASFAKGKNGDIVKCHTAFGVDNCIITAVVRAEKESFEVGKGSQTMEVNRLQLYDGRK